MKTRHNNTVKFETFSYPPSMNITDRMFSLGNGQSNSMVLLGIYFHLPFVILMSYFFYFFCRRNIPWLIESDSRGFDNAERWDKGGFWRDILS